MRRGSISSEWRGGSGHSRNSIYREGKEGRPHRRQRTTPCAAHRISAGLSIEGTGLVARNIKLDVFLIDPFIAVHAILLRIVIHGVVPPVEQGIGFRLIHRIPIIAPEYSWTRPTGDIVDLAVILAVKRTSKTVELHDRSARQFLSRGRVREEGVPSSTHRIQEEGEEEIP